MIHTFTRISGKGTKNFSHTQHAHAFFYVLYPFFYVLYLFLRIVSFLRTHCHKKIAPEDAILRSVSFCASIQEPDNPQWQFVTIWKFHIVSQDVRIWKISYLLVVFVSSAHFEGVLAVYLKVTVIFAVLYQMSKR